MTVIATLVNYNSLFFSLGGNCLLNSAYFVQTPLASQPAFELDLDSSPEVAFNQRGTTMFSLQIAKRECGPCRACCVSFPLLPNPDFWPEGKPVNQPCRYLCDKGCGIHDQPRPELCTGFSCAYLDGTIPWRPNECGVMVSPVSEGLAHAFRRQQWDGMFFG